MEFQLYSHHGQIIIIHGNLFKKNYLLIKYENLILQPEKEFLKITNFLVKIGDFCFDKKKILETIKNCNFENFVKQENKFGFKDNSATMKKAGKKIFKFGPKNNWRVFLDSKTKENIELSFRKEMEELNYL